jgi:two-component system, chemotaxis family, sensor kinase CheA
MTRLKKNTYLGKYREIVLAVAFFLVFDLAVLVLNFYISFQISEDALAINLAGRQRMLSQRMTKALLNAQLDAKIGLTSDSAFNELNLTVELFDTTLRGFEQGEQVNGGDGKPVMLAAVSTPQAQQLLVQARKIWDPLHSLLEPLKPGTAFSPAQLDAAVQYAVTNNVALLKLMNSLTTDLELTARAKADRLRLVQSAGVILALLNFGFILFKFVRRLRETDRQVELAQKETAEILDTVKEGLFLLDAEFRFGSQYSASLPVILGADIVPGNDFRVMLRKMVSTQLYEAACDYITLLFGDRVKEVLVQDINPLTAIEVQVPGRSGEMTRRYLTLQFNRVMLGKSISHLLVTVFDVTNQIELENALKDAKKKAKSEMGVLLGLLDVEPATLSQFLVTAEKTLLSINEQLRSASNEHVDYRRMIASIFRQMHTLKGDAAALGLTLFEDIAHQFESVLTTLRDKDAVSGEDLIGLPLPLDEFFERLNLVRALMSRLASYHDVLSPDDNSQSLSQDLKILAQRIAQDHGKEITISSNLQLFTQLPEQARDKVKAVAVQLLRNAVVHGIEPAKERIELNKPGAGNISVALKTLHDGQYEYELVLRDDGRGLIPRRIRRALVQSAHYSEVQLNEYSDVQILMKIFEPGFSTIAKANRDAGHGVGMDVVKEKLMQLGAHLNIQTRENGFTQFRIRFSV